MNPKYSFAVLFVFALVIMGAINVATARGRPQHESAFAARVFTVDAHGVVVVTSVPPMTSGFDVIQNMTAYPRLATANKYSADYSVARLSPTVAKRLAVRASTKLRRPAPVIVKLE